MSLQAAVRTLGLCVSCAIAVGCIDPEGDYDNFKFASTNNGAGGSIGDGGPCAPPPPGQGDGDFLVAVSTSLGVDTPILYFGHVSSPPVTSGSGSSILLNMAPVTASDRKTVLTQYQQTLGPFPIATDGSVVVTFPRGIVPGAANPIIAGTDVDSEATLSGMVCGVQDFYCGTVTGHVYSPIDSPITGNFGMMRTTQALLPLNPIYYDCAKDQAKPL